MGASVQQGGSTRGRSSMTTLAEINVTPLVDVMLVLLIIFMVSAPMMQQGMQIDLPKANSGALSEVPQQVVLGITKQRQLLIGDNAVLPGTLREKLAGIVAANPDVQVFIHADQSIPYGFVAEVMSEVKAAKVSRVGLVTQPGDPNKKL